MYGIIAVNWYSGISMDRCFAIRMFRSCFFNASRLYVYKTKLFVKSILN
jgi:hypothetical protein